MTEDEAKKKACPFVSGFIAHMNVSPHRCIASACMAWRTREKATGVSTKMNDGFCGLAGAPQ